MEELETGIRIQHLISSDEKLKYWGHGEWVEEPDFMEWEYKCIKCRIRRNASNEPGLGMGQLNGYVCIPMEHPWYKKEFNDSEEPTVNIHGGITFQDTEENGEYWIGFDCAHFRDEMPYKSYLSMKILYEQMGMPPEEVSDQLAPLLESVRALQKYDEEKVYRNIDYVKQECESLVDQMLEGKE
jgi:hypothetical protein